MMSIKEVEVSKGTEDENKFLNKKAFSKLIETTVFTKRLSYMDAILHVCEKNNIEPEDVKRYLNKAILENVEAEARSLNFLPKMNTLDV
jgi:cell division ATPase FtsA